MLHGTTKLLKRIAIETTGWLLVLAGIAALVLPGPGLILLAVGLFVLASQYEWAERRLEPVKERALRTATDGVATWPRILASLLGCLALVGIGVSWGLDPDVPDWWPIDERWWLPGGWGTGTSLIISGLIALGLLVYSFLNFRDTEPSQ